VNRIEKRMNGLRSRGEKGLGLFVTAGYPLRDSTPGLVEALEDGGADIIELGMPFSDPLADGPVIQNSSAESLSHGTTIGSILADVRRIRQGSEIPIVLMGYVNPILAYGEERFFAEAADAGVDGLILPEVPLEEYPRFAGPLRTHDLAGILLVTPASSSDRIEAIDARSSGFVYCVSATGVTGERKGRAPAEYLENVRRNAKRNPVLVGFGVSSPDDARAYAPAVDGVIVGSALIRFLSTSPEPVAIESWVRAFKDALQ
jgi:tryptophan synthase alpha chain